MTIRRSHKNNRARLTNKERAWNAAASLEWATGAQKSEVARVTQIAITAAVRAALARDDLRDSKWKSP
jgi:hypothetical protein